MQYRHKRYARSFVRSFLSFVFSRCGRFISRKIVPFCLCFVVLGLSLTVPSFASGTDGWQASDMDFAAWVQGSGGSGANITNDVTRVDNATLGGVTCSKFTIPSYSNTGATQLHLRAYEGHLLKANCEYNLKCSVYANWATATKFSVYVQYIVSGSVYKTQTLYEINPMSSYNNDWIHLDFNFIPDVSDISGGYTCDVCFKFEQNTSYSAIFGIANDIYLENLNDNSTVLGGILVWLSRLYHSIVGGEDTSGQQHTGIVQGISSALSSLGTSLSNGMSALGSNISTWLTGVKDGINNKLESVKTAITNAIDGIEQWFIDLKDNIINGLKSLFIPRDGYLAQKKTELETWCTAHFGALYQGPDVMLNLIRKLLTINPQQPSITMPAIQFKWNGETITLQESITYSFAWVNDSSHPVYYFYHIYKGFVTVILFVAFGNYLVNKYKNVFEGEGDPE